MQTTISESPCGPRGESNSIGYSEGRYYLLRPNFFDCIPERINSFDVIPYRFFIPFRREVLNIKRDTTALATRFGITVFLRQALHFAEPINFFMLMIEFHGP